MYETDNGPDLLLGSAGRRYTHDYFFGTRSKGSGSVSADSLLMAPIYPVLNSAMPSSLPKDRHAGTTGLMVVFSALGGTLGSIITGTIFAHAQTIRRSI